MYKKKLFMVVAMIVARKPRQPLDDMTRQRLRSTSVVAAVRGYVDSANLKYGDSSAGGFDINKILIILKICDIYILIF